MAISVGNGWPVHSCTVFSLTSLDDSEVLWGKERERERTGGDTNGG